MSYVTHLIQRVQRTDVRQYVRQLAGEDTRMILIDKEPHRERYTTNGHTGTIERFCLYLGESAISKDREFFGVLTRKNTGGRTKDYMVTGIASFPNRKRRK